MKQKLIYCLCGCRQKRLKYDKKGRDRKYIYGHQRRGKYKDKERFIQCICGCGIIIPKYDLKYVRRYYVNGHQNLGKKRSQKFCLQQSIRNKRMGIKPPSQKGMGGNRHWNWKGGISTVNNIIRKNSNSKLWSNKILKKDNYTCFLCNQYGPIKTNHLVAHHLLSWAVYKHLRWNIDNGICLCKRCHIKLHKKLREQKELIKE